MEDRRLLSITVDTLLDENDGVGVGSGTSLREAIAAAAPGDTINFAVTGTINLSYGTSNSTKQLTIDKNLTIQGPGANLLTIHAFDPTPDSKNGDGSQVFSISGTSSTQPISVTIGGLTLAGADTASNGGAIFAAANLEIDNCTVTNNRASDGGGIYDSNSNRLATSLTIRDSVVSGNAASGNGGGVSKLGEALFLENTTLADNSGKDGGAIYTNTRTTTCTDCTIQSNHATAGGGIFTLITTLTINGGAILHNTANYGGGMLVGEGTAAIRDCEISGNTATVKGGGMYLDTLTTFTLTNTTVRDNSANSGGGIFSPFEPALTVTNSFFDDNKALSGSGGGVWATGLIATGSEFSNNSATASGGALYSDGRGRGPLSITDCTISGNSAATGAGILMLSQGLIPNSNVTGSTISGNTATTDGGGIAVNGGMLKIQYCTITLNAAPQGHGGGVVSTATLASTVQFLSSIVAGNSQSDVDDSGTATTTFQSNGYNLIGAGNRALIFNQPGDQVGILDPLLAPLADNGGPTKTHALLAASPALNAGDPAAIAGTGTAPLYDQRGKPMSRIAGGRIDVGAYEFQPIPAAFMGDYNADGFVNALDYIVWRHAQGTTGLTPYTGADGTGDGIVGPDDYTLWRSHFGAVVPSVPIAGGGSALVATQALAEIGQPVAPSPSIDLLVAIFPGSLTAAATTATSKSLKQANNIPQSPHDQVLSAWLTIAARDTFATSAGDRNLDSADSTIHDAANCVDAAFESLDALLKV